MRPRWLTLALLLALAPGTALAEPAEAFVLAPPALIAAEARPPYLGRATLETAALLLGGTVWYWRDLEFNSRDWDLKWDVPSWRRKLTSIDAVRFDQNLFQTNAVSHPRAGVAHYLVARGNGLGFGGSAATALLTSVFWEYVIEFKEQPGLNDMIVNTGAGVAIGEPFYQLGEYLLRARPSLFSRGLASAFNPIGSANDLIEGRHRPVESADRFGFSREAAHRFAVSAGWQHRRFHGGETWDETALAAHAELVTQPGYARPGRFASGLVPGAFTSIDARLEAGERGVSGGTLVTRTSLVGHYRQDLTHTPGLGTSGWGRLIGLGSGFDYEDSGRPSGADYLASFNLVGPIFELTTRRDGLNIRWRSELYGDFALVHALAFAGRLAPMAGEVWHPAQSGGRIPGVVGARGYYYALGVTAGTRLDAAYFDPRVGGFDAGVDVRGDHFDSIPGFDRFREELTNEYDLVDRRVIGRAWIGWQPAPLWPRLSLGGDGRWRSGVAGNDGGPADLSNQFLDVRLAVLLSFMF